MSNSLWQDQVVAARRQDIAVVARERVPRLWRTSEGFEGPCPRCGGRDRFSVNVRKQVFNCRGAEGNDVIGMVQHISGCSFREAVIALTGDQVPQDLSTRRSAVKRDQANGRSDLRQNRRIGHELAKAAALFSAAKPLSGTKAEAYFEARGIAVHPRWAGDVRFCGALPYWGYNDAIAATLTFLGNYPAILAAIRDAGGTFIGVHRTYLDREMPRKLLPPGDRRRNGAKKVLGRAGGGLIRLSPIEPVMAIGEGVETTLSWYALGAQDIDVGIAAGISLGNLAGSLLKSAAGSRSGEPVFDPDMERPGLILPPEVKEVILLQDGDSDPSTTVAKMVCAMRRFEAMGIRASIDEAPAGRDFNDVLLEEHLEA